MINIYQDFHKTLKPEPNSYTLVAYQVQDYIPLRQALRRALNDPDHDYTVYIQHRILGEWLRDLREYPTNLVSWGEINLREQFRQKYDISLPVELDDLVIKNLNLLGLLYPTQNEMNDPVGWILGSYLDPVWRVARPSDKHLSDLAAWTFQSNSIDGSISQMVNKRLSEWIQSDRRYRIFVDQPWQIAGELILLKWALRTYPNDLRLRQQLNSVPDSDCQHHSQLARISLEKHSAELTEFWQISEAGSSLDAFLAALQVMSGLTYTELSILENWAIADLTYLTHSLLDKIRNRFAILPEVNEVMYRLEILIPPTFPQPPDNSWSTENWLMWATEEYMPYFAWIIRNNQPRDKQIKLARYFADWLVKAYPNLIFDQNTPIVTNQLSYLEKLFANKPIDTVFWFIIDGLTWWQGKRLSEFCTNLGLGIIKSEPNLSALPSVTFVSKRAIVQGYIDDTTAKQPVAKLLEKNQISKTNSIYVYSQTSQFESAISSDPQAGIHVLLYNALDQHNHGMQSFTDDESIDGHLRLLARLLNTSFKQCSRQGLNATALVSSDHGSTLLPVDSKTIKVPHFAQTVEDDDFIEADSPSKHQKHYQRARTCTLETEPNQNELEQLESSWYLLRRELFNLPKHFLIPTDYVAITRQPKGWTHGGATPEETVVPFFEIQSHPVEIMPPIVQIQGYFLPNQTSTLHVTIINPNSIPLQAVRFSLTDCDNIIEVSRLAANAQALEELEVPKASTQGKTQIIEWLFTCETGGHHRQFNGQLELSVRRFQVSEVDDLFEGLL